MCLLQESIAKKDASVNGSERMYHDILANIEYRDRKRKLAKHEEIVRPAPSFASPC